MTDKQKIKALKAQNEFLKDIIEFKNQDVENLKKRQMLEVVAIQSLFLLIALYFTFWR